MLQIKLIIGGCVMVLKGYAVGSLKDILQKVEENIYLLKGESGIFHGLIVELYNNELIFYFNSSSELFDNFLYPFFISLNRDYDFKTGFLEYYFVYDLIKAFKNNKVDDLKVEIDDDLTYFKVLKNDTVILEYNVLALY
jgi:hypothetical protein